jgi:anthranilate phosphoribosyltransferase
MKYIIEKLLNGINLTQEEARSVMLRIMSGEYDDAQISGFLIAFRSKGENYEEIAGFAQAMRDKMTPIECVEGAIDMCGTGGDALGTFNISTAASFVVAAAGVPVAKHGNRSMTSKSGSADVLTALGINISLSPEKVSTCIQEIGIGFMFAPSLHPAMKFAMGARKSLAVRTVFNILGPLCNPAGVKRQLIGIFDGSLTDKVARVLQRLGSVHALVVHGHDGLDEISTADDTGYTELKPDGEINSGTLSPSDFGLSLTDLKYLKGGSPDENAEIVRSIFNGEKGPHRDIVLVNAAAGIMVGGKVETILDGIHIAEECIDSGAVNIVLNSLIAVK